MKSTIKSLLLFCLFALTFVSCETYSDPKVDYAPIYPLSGEWRVRITNLSTNTVLGTTTAPTTPAMFTLGTYNTSNNDVDSMWIRITSTIPFNSTLTPQKTTLKAKINCDVPNLSFQTVGVVKNINVTTNAIIDTLIITDAKITPSSVVLPSKVVSDRISFKLTKSRTKGVVFLVEGYRRTQWAEDESVIAFQ